MKESLLKNTFFVGIAIFICASVFSACSKNEDGVITDTTELRSLIDSCEILLAADTTGYSPAAQTAYITLENEIIIIQISLINSSISQKQVNLIISGLKITKTALEATIAVSNATKATSCLQLSPINRLISGQRLKDNGATIYKIPFSDFVVHHFS